MNEGAKVGPGTVVGFIVAVLAPLIGLVVGGFMYAAGHQTNGKKVAVLSVAMFVAWFLLLIILAAGGSSGGGY